MRSLIAVVLLACVLAIVISPFVDLPVSTLRARIAALVCQLALIALATALSRINYVAYGLAPAPPAPALPAGTSPDVTCSWIC